MHIFFSFSPFDFLAVYGGFTETRVSTGEFRMAFTSLEVQLYISNTMISSPYRVLWKVLLMRINELRKSDGISL